jgi:hypothetical protein
MDWKFSAMTLFAFSDEVAAQVRLNPEIPERIRLRNELIRDRFEKDVIAAGWHRLRKGDVFVPRQDRHSLVVGSVLWSRDDLNILATLASKHPRSNADIHIFNLDDVRSQDDLRRFMPGVPLPAKTSVVAEYVHGVLQRFAEGAAVTTFLNN